MGRPGGGPEELKFIKLGEGKRPFTKKILCFLEVREQHPSRGGKKTPTWAPSSRKDPGTVDSREKGKEQFPAVEKKTRAAARPERRRSQSITGGREKAHGHKTLLKVEGGGCWGQSEKVQEPRRGR